MRVSEQLNLAADLIQTHGWAKGVEAWSPMYGSGLCLEGGIAAAVGIQGDADHIAGNKALQMCPAYLAVENYLGEETYDCPLWEWNDDQPNGTRVIEVLRAVAAVEAAREEALADVGQPA